MLANELMGLGFPAGQAVAIGVQTRTLAGAGTAQVGGTAINVTSTAVTATTAGGETALVLPLTAPLWRPYFIYNSTSTTALIFPPSGHDINAAGANASAGIAVTLARVFIRVSATHWISFLTA